MPKTLNTTTLTLPTGTARSMAVIPARAGVIAWAATLPGWIVTLALQNLLTVPTWLGFAAPVVKVLGFHYAA